MVLLKCLSCVKEFFVPVVYFFVFYPSLFMSVTSCIWCILELLSKFCFGSRVVPLLEAVIEID